jgi:hypothetical protein
MAWRRFSANARVASRRAAGVAFAIKSGPSSVGGDPIAQIASSRVEEDLVTERGKMRRTIYEGATKRESDLSDDRRQKMQRTAI